MSTGGGILYGSCSQWDSTGALQFRSSVEEAFLWLIQTSLFLGNGISVQCCDGCAVGLTHQWVPSYCHVPGICAKLVYADPSDAQLYKVTLRWPCTQTAVCSALNRLFCTVFSAVTHRHEPWFQVFVIIIMPSNCCDSIVILSSQVL